MPVGDQAARRAGVEVEDLALPAGAGRHLELRIFRPRMRPAQIDVLVLVFVEADSPAGCDAAERSRGRTGSAEELARGLSGLLDRAVALPRLEGIDPAEDAPLLGVLLAWILDRGRERGLRAERLAIAAVGAGAEAVCDQAQRRCGARLAGPLAARSSFGEASGAQPSAEAVARRLALEEASGQP